MKIVVDTNRIIAALVRDSTTRAILFDDNFKFVTPDFTVTEIIEHANELKPKTKLSDEDFEVLLNLLFEYVEIIPEPNYKGFIEDCKKDMSDSDDVPILACAIAVKAGGIWAHDPHFKEQKKVKVFTNIDMLELSRKSKS